MNFRLSLQNWLLVILALLLTVALTAIYGFYRIGAAASEPVENVPWLLQHTQEMNQALEQQELFLIRTLTKERNEDVQTDAFTSAENAFELALKSARERTVTAQSLLALAEIQDRWQHWLNVSRAFTEGTSESDSELQEVYSSFLMLKSAVRKLAYSSLELMSRARLDVELSTRLYAWWLVFLATLGVLLSIKFNQRIVQTVIRPVGRMTRFLDRAILGELHLRLGLVEDEHLNALILSCNRLIENLQNVTEESRRRIRHERNLAVALIDLLEPPTVALNPGNEVLLANSSARLLLSGTGGNTLLNQLTNCLKMQRTSFQHEGVAYKVHVLQTEHTPTFQGTLIQFST